jgi:hypothetical protein
MLNPISNDTPSFSESKTNVGQQIKKNHPLPFSRISRLESKLHAHVINKCNEILRQLKEIKAKAEGRIVAKIE